MITPQEVAQHSFNKATFNGYNMAQVDDFLDVLTADYTALYKENAVLKGKMKVLAEKIEEYRSTEDAMRAALLTAQKMANNLVSEAEDKKAQLLKDVEGQAAARKRELEAEVAAEERRLAAAQQATADFVAAVRAALSKEEGVLESLPEIAAPAPAPAPAEEAAPVGSVEETARQIQDSMQHILEEEFADSALSGEKAPAPKEEPAPAPEDDSPTRRIDFSDLKFGKDYEIK